MSGKQLFTPEQIAAILAADRAARGDLQTGLAGCAPDGYSGGPSSQVPFVPGQQRYDCDPSGILSRPRTFEVSSSGFDPYRQMVSDPFGGPPVGPGLVVPQLSTPDNATALGLSLAQAQNVRYLALLCSFSVGDGACVTLLGYRQGATLYTTQSGAGGAILRREFPVTTPWWTFPQGNISWHIRVMQGPPNGGLPRPAFPAPVVGPLPAPASSPGGDFVSFKQYWSDSSAILWGPPTYTMTAGTNPFTGLLTYTPPNLGKPYGQGITTKLGTFYDMRTQWNVPGSWEFIGMPVRGPATVAFFASIYQPKWSSQQQVTPPSTFFPLGMTPEDQFLLNYGPTSTIGYGRVWGSMFVHEQ